MSYFPNRRTVNLIVFKVMLNWLEIQSMQDIDRIKDKSYKVPQVIFKHSNRCFTSKIVKSRFEDEWDYAPSECEAHFLDIFSYRDISNYIAEHFHVHHESPQLLMISNGEVIYDDSHQDIRVETLKTVEL